MRIAPRTPRPVRRARIRKSQMAGSIFYLPAILIMGALILMIAFEAIVIVAVCAAVGALIVVSVKAIANRERRLPKGITRVQ